ncbi:MAG: ABC transporter permease [Paludibacter sp.]|nr:ABC transporter permease [Paludibacter sp.]
MIKWGFRSVLFGFVFLILLILLADVLYINNDAIKEVYQSDYIRNALLLTIETSLTTLVLCILIGVPVAYTLSKAKSKGFIIADILIDLLIILPIIVIGISILVFFRVGTDFTQSGNPIVSFLGSIVQSLGEFFIYTKAGIVLVQFFCSIPFTVRAIKAGFDQINPRLEQVALILGCTPTQAFFKVSLPLAKSSVVAGAILGWARAFGLYGAVAIVAGTVRNKTEVLSSSVFLEISIGRVDIALVISLLMIIIAFVVLLSFRLVFKDNIFGTSNHDQNRKY